MSDTLPPSSIASISSLDQYQREAERTVGANTLTTLALGLCGEAGEFADKLKKQLAQGHTFTREQYLKELGDVLWYVANAARQLDANLSDVAQLNIDKLRARYPQGFEAARSVNREETGE